MTIGLDLFIHGIREGTLAGIASYTKTLIEGLLQWGSDHEYVVYANSRARLEPSILQLGTIKRVWAPSRGSAWWEQLYFATPGSTRGLDLIHNPHSAPLKRCRVKQVVTVHDVIPLIEPEAFTKRNRVYWSFVWSSLHRVDAVITVSEWSKRDIVTRLRVDPDRVNVVYPALRFSPTGAETASGVASTLTKYRIRKPYILYVGTLEPRKNVPTLLKAFKRLLEVLTDDLQLVIVGKTGWLFQDVFRTTEELGLQEKVVFTGFVPTSELPALYSSASVFVFPSLYEGFGLPPLEAMAFGVPVVVSNRASLPEVVGDAGILVDPTDPEEIAFQIKRVLEDSQLREVLGRKGLERAARFSVERLAKETLKVYESLK
ncbi:glycosyltransferase family 4 protein [Coprothermobacteraceae bacterium]|nr:glycosyltransferase family 4 protein [Coprothermobacteraceae bacterium]